VSSIRVGIVGLGWAGRSIWLPRLHAHPNFAVVAAVDPEPVSRRSAQQDWPEITLLADLDGLGVSDVDLAVVAVPNHLHHDIAHRLLSRGISVFLEKPVCLSVTEADSLAAAERAGGAVLMAGSAACHRADVRALHGLSAELGLIRHVELSWIRARGIPSGNGWFTQRRLSGGGVLVDLGWHLLDVAGLLLGDAAISQVAGTMSADFIDDGARSANWRQDVVAGGVGDVEDTANAFLVTEHGASVTLRASWASHERRDVTLVNVYGNAGTARLCCTFGFSPNRQDCSTLTVTRDGETVPHPLPEEPVGAEYDRQLDEIHGLLAGPAIRGRAIVQARRAVEVIERVYGSAQRRSA
jgi:oxidoreductase